MKHFIIIGIFLILSLVPVFGEQEFNKLVMLSNDSTHYIIADLVNIRAYPSTDAPIVGTARLCKPVKVWEMTDETDKLYGLEAHWYSVQVNEVNGYLWGGLISSQEVIADFDGDGIDEYLLIRATSSHFTYTGEYMSYFKQKAFLYRRGKLISENPFTNELLDSSKLIKVENKGFSPGVVFLKASVSAADAGEFAATSHYYYLSQNKFHLICELHSGGGYGSETRMYPVFPTSQGGKKNTIIIKETNTYIPDYHKGGTASKEETQIIAEYTWNGTVFRKTR